MKNNLPTYIMHYTPNVDRKRVLSNILKKELFENITWIEDYDREVLTEQDFLKYFNPSQQEVDRRQNHLKTVCLTPEEASLCMKHYVALNDFYNSGFDYALFLEDDAILTNDFIEKFEFYFENIPSDFEIGFINHGYPEDRIDDPDKKYWHRVYWPKAVKFSDAMVFAKSAVGKILEGIQNHKFCHAIDHEYSYWIREYNLGVYWLEPPISAQGSQCGLFQSFQLKYGSNYFNPELMKIRNDWENILNG